MELVELLKQQKYRLKFLNKAKEKKEDVKQKYSKIIKACDEKILLEETAYTKLQDEIYTLTYEKVMRTIDDLKQCDKPYLATILLEQLGVLENIETQYLSHPYYLDKTKDSIFDALTEYYIKHRSVQDYASLLKDHRAIKSDKEIESDKEKFTEALKSDKLVFKPHCTFDFDKYIVKFIELLALDTVKSCETRQKRDLDKLNKKDLIADIAIDKYGPVVSFLYAGDDMDRAYFKYTCLLNHYDKKVKEFLTPPQFKTK